MFSNQTNKMNLKFKRIVSLARKRSKNITKEKEVLESLMPQYSVIVPEDGGAVQDIQDIFFKSNKFLGYVLEIGFGSGENILFNAKNNPELGYIGCEVFTSGVVTLLKDIEKEQISNIRIWHDDALELIPRLPNNSLKLVYILHPDPWPKRRHNNRRLINEEFLKLLATKLKNNGQILIITDHQDYAQAINKAIQEVKDIFEKKENNYPPITKTKYRLKADALGHESKYFLLEKEIATQED